MNFGNEFGKIISLFVVVAMMFSAVGISSFSLVEAEQTIAPVDAETEDTAQPDLMVTKLVADTPVIYLDQKNPLTVSIANEGEVQALKVTAKIFDIVPKQSEELITSLNLGALMPGMEKSRFVDWTPTVLGIHYIKVEMNCEYLTHNSPAEMVESVPTIISAGFPVAPLSDTEYWGPNGDYPCIINFANDPSGFRYRDGPLTIIVQDGDLEIWSGATLQLNNDIMFIIECPNQPGEFGVDIQSSGKFIVNSLTTPTTITTSSQYRTNTYFFENRGTVDFAGANVMYTYGPSDTALAGGIQNYADSTCIIEDCKLIDADTHSLYISDDVDIQFQGSSTVIGSEEDPGVADVLNGHGIFVNAGTPVIEGVVVQYQKLDGIHIENSLSDTPIMAANLQNYTSNEYDYRLTFDPAESVCPHMVTGDGTTLYLVWLDDRSGTDQIYFIKSDDRGVTWSDDVELTYEPYSPSQVGIAANGNAIHLFFVYPSITSEYWKCRVMYMGSTDSGENWNDPVQIGIGINPSVAVDDENVYIAYQTTYTNPIYFNGQIGSQVVVTRSIDGGESWLASQTFYHSAEYQSSTPMIDANGSNVYMVWVHRLGEMYYTYSSDYGETWSQTDAPYPVLATPLPIGNFSQDSFDISALGEWLYVVWSSEAETNACEVRAKFGNPSEGTWIERIITNSAAQSIFPRCTTDAAGTLFIVWQDDRNGQEEVRYLVLDSGGNALVNDMSMSPDSPGAYKPSISIDSSGYAYLAWTDVRDGNSEIYVKRANQLFVKENIISNNKYGITIWSSQHFLIESNSIISNSDWGIYLLMSNNNELKNNDIQGASYGIRYYSSSSNNLHDNVLANYDFGVHLSQNCKYNSISNNEIIGCKFGVTMQIYCSNNQILYNGVYASTYSIYNTDSGFNDIYYNNLNIGGYDSDGRNNWDNGYPSGGNYWSDWTYPDMNSDGFVDTPKLIAGGTSQDNWPFTTEDGWLNNPPTAPTIDVTPDDPITADDLTCTVITPSIDPDGDTITYTYKWYRDQGAGFVLQQELTSTTTALSATIASSNTITGELWMCVVTPNDGTVNGPIDIDVVAIG